MPVLAIHPMSGPRAFTRASDQEADLQVAERPVQGAERPVQGSVPVAVPAPVAVAVRVLDYDQMSTDELSTILDNLISQRQGRICAGFMSGCAYFVYRPDFSSYFPKEAQVPLGILSGVVVGGLAYFFSPNDKIIRLQRLLDVSPSRFSVDPEYLEARSN